MQCQITIPNRAMSNCSSLLPLPFALNCAVKLFLRFFGLQYLIIAFFKFCILAIYNLFQLGKL